MHLNGNNDNDSNETKVEHWWEIYINTPPPEQKVQPVTMMSNLSLHQNQQISLLDNKGDQQKLFVHKNYNKDKKTASNNDKKYKSWLDIFAEIDPLANPEAFDFKLHDSSKNIEQA